jgi:hypothetical protein
VNKLHALPLVLARAELCDSPLLRAIFFQAKGSLNLGIGFKGRGIDGPYALDSYRAGLQAQAGEVGDQFSRLLRVEGASGGGWVTNGAAAQCKPAKKQKSLPRSVHQLAMCRVSVHN